MKAFKNVGLALTVAVVVLALLFSVFLSPSPVAHASIPQPLAIPTPVVTNPGQGTSQLWSFFSTKVITQDTTSGCVNSSNYDKVDLQWVFDQTIVDSAANTTTVKLQFSNNNGSNMVDGATAVSNNAADATDMQQFAVFGACTKVFLDVSNTLPVTVTVIGVGK